MRPIHAARQVVLAGALMLAAAACSAGTAPPAASHGGGSRFIAGDCVDLEHGGQHLALDVVKGLHPLDPAKASLNNDYTTGDGTTVEQLAWVLFGARSQQDADGELFVYATDRSSSFPAIESMQRTIVEASGPSAEVRDLDLGRARVAGRAAETAAVPSKNGDYDAWTFTSVKNRFIVVTHQLPRTGAFELSRRVPNLLAAGGCTDA